MGTSFKWSETDKQTLISCTTPEEMMQAFPQKKLTNLLRRQTEFKSERNGKSNGSQKVNSVPLTMNRKVDFSLESDNTIEMTVPLSTHNKILRQLDETRNRKAIFVNTLKEAVFEAAQDIRTQPITPHDFSIDKTYTPKEEIAVLDVGDWQLGAIRPTYNSEICSTRIQLLARKVKEIIEIQRSHHPVKELHLRCLGDMVENTGIYNGQSHQVDSSLYRQMFNGIGILTQLVLDLLETVDTIHFVGIVGNHGQIRLANGENDPETNMDRLLYQVTRMVLEGPDSRPNTDIKQRITWDVPDGRGETNWYAIDHIFDWNHLIFHGDQIRGGAAGFPWAGVTRKAWGWIDSIEEPWDQMHFGHWHTPARMTLNKRIAIANGSSESNNNYAQENLAAIGHPTQWLGFVSPKQELTGEYWISLSEKDSVAKVPAKLRNR